MAPLRKTPPREDAPVAVTLRDGRTVTVREGRAGDEPAIRGFLEGLSPETRQLRFFSCAIDLEQVTRSLTRAGPGSVAVLALDETGTIVGHAVSIELEPGRAEIAVEVDDRLHGEGLGTILVERLAELAEQRGVTTFEAQVLPDNRAMLDVLRDGFDAHAKWSDGVDAVEFPTCAWRIAHERYRAMFNGP